MSDGQTDRQTLCDDIGHAYAQHGTANSNQNVKITTSIEAVTFKKELILLLTYTCNGFCKKYKIMIMTDTTMIGVWS